MKCIKKTCLGSIRFTLTVSAVLLEGSWTKNGIFITNGPGPHQVAMTGLEFAF